jgi:hypothetical protein
MILNYKSDYPNQVHQLSVSVSKHYYVTKAGKLKYQKKKQEVNLDNVTNSERIHVVHYVLRDHCSGLFYAELALSNGLIPVQEFLYRAWAIEKDYTFYGVPKMLAIPDTVEKKFPKIKERVAWLGIELIKVTSGFQGGIRDIKTIEQYIGFCEGYSIEKALTEIKGLYNFLNRQKSRNGKDTKIDLWRNHVKELAAPRPEWLDEFNDAGSSSST